jgi:hypothetical protein
MPEEDPISIPREPAEPPPNDVPARPVPSIKADPDLLDGIPFSASREGTVHFMIEDD